MRQEFAGGIGTEAGAGLHVTVRCTPGLRRTFRASRRLRRGVFTALRVVGVLFAVPVLATAVADGRLVVAGLDALLVGFALVEPELLIWCQLRRDWESRLDPVELTVTDECVIQRSPVASVEAVDVGWDRVRRVITAKDFWIFVIDGHQAVTLYRAFLTPAQAARLSAFLATRPPYGR